MGNIDSHSTSILVLTKIDKNNKTGKKICNKSYFDITFKSQTILYIKLQDILEIAYWKFRCHNRMQKSYAHKTCILHLLYMNEWSTAETLTIHGIRTRLEWKLILLKWEQNVGVLVARFDSLLGCNDSRGGGHMELGHICIIMKASSQHEILSSVLKSSNGPFKASLSTSHMGNDTVKFTSRGVDSSTKISN